MFLSTMESQTLEADPGICPSAYHGLRDLLKKYMKLLIVMLGDQCHHPQEIRGIYRAFGAMVSTYETMSPELVVAIVWQSSSMPGAFLAPRSRSSGIATVIGDNVNYQLFHQDGSQPPKSPAIGMPATELPPSASPSDLTSFIPSRFVRIAMFPSGYPPSTHINQTHVNTKPIPALVSIMPKKKREQQPAISMADLLRSKGIKFTNAALGQLGTCLDFTYFMKCDTPNCLYKHDAPPVMGTARTNALVKKMEKAISGYLARNASWQFGEVDAVNVSRTTNIDILPCPSVNNEQTRKPCTAKSFFPLKPMAAEGWKAAEVRVQSTNTPAQVIITCLRKVPVDIQHFSLWPIAMGCNRGNLRWHCCCTWHVCVALTSRMPCIERFLMKVITIAQWDFKSCNSCAQYLCAADPTFASPRRKSFSKSWKLSCSKHSQTPRLTPTHTVGSRGMQ